MKVAVIDHDGLILRVEPHPEGRAPTAHEIPVPDHSDLEPGKARWDAEAGTFHFVEPAEPDAIDERPHTVRAIAAGFIALHKAGISLPAETRRWLVWYLLSLDGLGVVPPEEAPACIESLRTKVER